MTKSSTALDMRETLRNAPDLAALYKEMCRIRALEEALLSAFSGGELRGTTHTCLGQEAIAVASMAHVAEPDIVFSNHRCHGHFLAYGGDMEQLLLEIMGDAGGVCGGLGGSQHLQYRNFYSNGIQGGFAPVASGMALAEKLRGGSGLAVAFLGDGTLGEGAVYEAFNLASLWSLPVLFVIENNRISQSTPQALNLAGSIPARARAFGIETHEHDGNDVLALHEAFAAAFAYVRREGRPFCQVVNTARLGPHSKGDDPRPAEELARLRQGDPLVVSRHDLSEQAVAAIRCAAEAEVAEVVVRAKARAAAAGAMLALDADDDPSGTAPDETEADGLYVGEPMLGVEHLRETLHELMADPDTFLIGEDLVDPYGGAFKASRGLSTKYPDRVLTTPISESAIVGIANGAALRGMRPIAEIMFGDFLTLATDQIVNHASKFIRMYGRKLGCPLVIRAPMGGYRGYGPTHSQSLEKMFLGVPGLTVAAFSPVHDQRVIWAALRAQDGPSLYIENKLLYGQRMMPVQNGTAAGFHARSSRGRLPTIALNLAGFAAPADISILTYGGMTPMAMDAARRLFVEDELSVEVVVFSQLAPLPPAELEFAAARSRRFLTLEEGTKRGGWGSEMAARFLERFGAGGPVLHRVAALDTIIPNSAQGELKVLPSVDVILKSAREIMNHG